MAVFALPDHFGNVFSRLNPTVTFTRQAASEHTAITRLIEDAAGPARELAPRCVLQGSYKQQTAIHSISDVDIVALCRVRPPVQFLLSRAHRWRRDEIFKALAAALEADARFRGRLRFSGASMCIKVDLGIRVEVLPVIYHSMFADFDADTDREPFLLYRPGAGRWEDGYARTHQRRLSEKNRAASTAGNFIPMVKVMKHLRTFHRIEAISFHLECLLYALPDSLFRGTPATYIPALLHRLAATSAEAWYNRGVSTPCGERNIFTSAEWDWANWKRFHEHVVFFDLLARAASLAPSKDAAIQTWQVLFGSEVFPTQVST